ncbi:MAG: TIGR01777 family oxidoreductase [Bdellovibrionota bacterium]
MRVLLTGASGFVGRALGAALKARGDSVIAVSRGKEKLPFTSELLSWDELPQARDIDAVVHLAGENVAQRWTKATKKRIFDSRIEGLRKLAALPVKPARLVSASAIGFYGDRGDTLLQENAAPGGDFLARVCVEWEKAAVALKVPQTVILRFGLVLGKGGALDRMAPPFRLGLGGRLGSGKQWQSWIQLDDLVALLVRSLSSGEGIYNAVAPQPVRNEEFTRALAGVLGAKARLPAPAFVLRLAFGEMSGMLLGSQRVSSERLLSEGFQFRYPSIIEALRASL